MDTGRRIILRVAEAVQCPLFQNGDQMVLKLPGIDKEASTDICVLALSKFLPVQQQVDCGSFKLVVKQLEFRCPRPHDPVRFEVIVRHAEEGRTAIINRLAGSEARSIEALKTIPILKPLSATALTRLLSVMRIESFAAGETILRKGEPGKALYIVYRGEVQVTSATERGQTSVVRVLRERECFGEMSLLTGAPVNATVRAPDEVSLLVIDAPDFHRLLQDNPVLAMLFTRLLAERLTATTTRLADTDARAFAGKLGLMSLAEVLQSLSEGKRSGTLLVETPGDLEGRLAFREGRIWRIERGGATGAEQLFRMMSWAEGDFSFDTGLVPEVDEVGQDVMNLLLEGMRRLDEASASLSAGAVDGGGDVGTAVGETDLPPAPPCMPTDSESGPA